MTRAIVVCPKLKYVPPGEDAPQRDAAARLEEAVNLAEAIALEIVQGLIYTVAEVRPATVIGTGQMDQIAEIAKAESVKVVVFDCALTPMQQRNLERHLHAKVIDRNALILEIFGERARTKEGKLQVELAALEYQKSRLVRSWTHLERQRGGYGFLGGPGESQIETDRRLIRDRIALIKKQLQKVIRTRHLHRQLRDHVPYPTVALVGYTNAGKSTLFNRLTSAQVYAQDALFATLDPTTRKLALPSGMDILLSDTVGFISNLPTQLIAAFRATLEEVRQADLLLHVRDITHQDSKAQSADVMEVIQELFDKDETIPPIIEVWNKCDMAEPSVWQECEQHNPVCVSAHTGEGIDALLESIRSHLNEALYTDVIYDVPLSDGKAQAWLYNHGIIHQIESLEEVMRMTVGLSDMHIQQFYRECGLRPYFVDEDVAQSDDEGQSLTVQ